MSIDPSSTPFLFLAQKEDSQIPKGYSNWANERISHSNDTPQPKNGTTPCLDLQPRYWLDLGVDILSGNQFSQGNDKSEIIVYPVFQAGAEIFLKGMWLSQFEYCRNLKSRDYIPSDKVDEYFEKLIDLHHDLLDIIGECKKINEYQTELFLCFLSLVSGIIKLDYNPYYRAQKSVWAAARYPVRWQNEAKKTGQAEILKAHWPKQFILKPFMDIRPEIIKLWELQR